MSPDEKQLRAALREGEGDIPDADAIIWRALQQRRERRQHWRAAAGGLAAAAVVAGLAVGITHVGGNESARASGGSALAGADNAAGMRSADAPMSAARPQSAAGGASNAASSASSVPSHGNGMHHNFQTKNAGPSPNVAAPATCPKQPAHYAAPPPGGGTLFPRPVAEMTACGYTVAPNGKTTVVSVALARKEARSLARTLDGAPRQPNVMNCMLIRNPPVIELLAVDRQGTSLRPVTITPRCTSVLATNGHAATYPSASSPAVRKLQREVNR